MVEVRFPHKNQKRNLMVDGELVEFRDGVAYVNEKQAALIREMDNPEYQVLDVEEKPLKVKKPRRSVKAKK